VIKNFHAPQNFMYVDIDLWNFQFVSLRSVCELPFQKENNENRLKPL
jgi:hypothetical protein